MLFFKRVVHSYWRRLLLDYVRVFIGTGNVVAYHLLSSLFYTAISYGVFLDIQSGLLNDIVKVIHGALLMGLIEL